MGSRALRLSVTFVALWWAGAAPVAAAPAPADYWPGQAIVRVHDGTSAEAVVQVAEAVQGKVARQIAPATYLITFDDELPVPTALTRLAQHPAVQYVEPNYRVQAFGGSSDPLNVSGTAPGAVVAVLDTGLDLTHSAFTGRLWTNPGEIAGNGVDDDGDGYVDDVHGYDFYDRDGDPTGNAGAGAHGTAVAGRVVAGAADGVTIMPLRVGPGPSLSTAAIIEAIGYAVQHGARVITMSFGTWFSSQALAEAVQRAAARDVLLVAAAGNDGANFPNYPAAYPSVLAVAATDDRGVKASFSTYGPWVDFSAPGLVVTTTAFGGGTTTASGTSFAAPFVAGVLARVAAAHLDWTSQRIAAFVRAFATDPALQNPAFKGQLGAGFVGTDAARRVAEATPLAPPTPLPSALVLTQQAVTRLTTELALAQQSADAAQQAQDRATSAWAAAHAASQTALHRYLGTWWTWWRATAWTRSKSTATLTTAWGAVLTALAKERDALQRWQQAASELRQAQERRQTLQAQLVAARRRADELTLAQRVGGGPRSVATAGQQEVQALVRSLRAVHDTLGQSPLPAGLSASELPDLAGLSAASLDDR